MFRPLVKNLRTALSKKPTKTRNASPRNTRAGLMVEQMESRELMSVTSVVGASILANQNLAVYYPPWKPTPTAAGFALINGLTDPTVRAAALTDYTNDGQITRNDMIDIFRKGTNQLSFLTASAYTSLLTLVNNAGTVDMPFYVQDLAYKVLNSPIPSGYYASGVLSNPNFFLYQDIAGQAVGQAVDNFFLGQVHPLDSYVSGGQTITPAYQQVNLPLFSGVPTYADVNQGALGDCWLMASLAEVADRSPSTIENMFINNGDGTYTVRFYHNSVPDYVTVDTYLPSGGSLYDHPKADLWAALAEKAYVQENAGGWIGSQNQGVESYQALNGGYASWALSAITCLSTTSTSIYNYNILGLNFNNASGIVSAWTAGQFVVVCTGDSPQSSLVVPDHCYAMINYASSMITLYNPWGLAGGYSGDNGKYYPGMIEGTVPAIAGSFNSYVVAGGGATTTQPVTQVVGLQTLTDVRIQPILPQNGQNLLGGNAGLDHAMLFSVATTQNQGATSPLGALDGAFADLLGQDWLKTPAL